MEKKQYDLCLEILKRFHKTGILGNLILIGSWCTYFYKEYFFKNPYFAQIVFKTRDIDFLIDKPSSIRHKVDISNLLADLGFAVDFKGHKGYIKFDHPDLILEFLTPEKGRGVDKPYPLPALGINATALRFLDFLSDNTIKVKVEDFYLTLPHPANFALHKLIIFQRRTKEDKAIKDREAAIGILKALVDKGEADVIKKVFDSVPQKWQKKILIGLDEIKDKDILGVLQGAEERRWI